MEIIIMFVLVYMVYVIVVDLKKGLFGIIVFIVIGFIVGVNILVVGLFFGGFMNLVCFFGLVVVSGDFNGMWIYWVGLLIGGGLVGFIYGNVFMNFDYVLLFNDF